MSASVRRCVACGTHCLADGRSIGFPARRTSPRPPDIPLTYLASIPEGFDANDLGVPEWDRKIIGAQGGL
jgi:hypothetical protein